MKLLHEHVNYVTHSLGRHHVSRGGLVPPWEPDYNPADYEKVSGVSVRERGEALLFHGDDGDGDR